MGDTREGFGEVNVNLAQHKGNTYQGTNKIGHDSRVLQEMEEI